VGHGIFWVSGFGVSNLGWIYSIFGFLVYSEAESSDLVKIFKTSARHRRIGGLDVVSKLFYVYCGG